MKILPQARSNSFVSNSFFIFLVRFFPSLANLFIIIFFSHSIGRQDYGMYQNFWVQLYVLSAAACLGIQALVITYQPTLIVQLIKSLKSRSYLLLSGWIVLCAGLFSFLQKDIHSLLAFAFLVSYSASIILESIVMVFRKFRLLVSLNTVYTIIFCLLHGMAVADKWSFDKLFSYLLVLCVLKLVMLAVAMTGYIANHPEFTGDTHIGKIRRLWLHLGIYDVSQTFFRWIDKFVVSLLLAKEVSAIYFNGSLEIPFLPLLLGAAGSAALMQLAAGQNGAGSAVQLVNRSGRLLSSIVFPLFFFFLIYRSELITIVLSDKFLPAIPIFAVSVLAMPLRAYSFTTILQNRHRGDIINAGAVIDLLLACGLMYPLYKLMGLPGIALSFVISSYLQAGFYIFYTSRELDVPALSLLPLPNWTIKLIIFALLFIAFYYFTSGLFTQQFVLILGCLFAILVCAGTLGFELVTEKRKYGSDTKA